jgi:putative ABC transport system permease protein
MNLIFHNIHYSIRSLVKRPGFTIVAVIVLALGIGANTAIFSVVNSVLLNPLPYQNPDELVIVRATNPSRGLTDFGVSMPDFREWRTRNRVFERLAAFSTQSYNISSGPEPERIDGAMVSADLFPLLGVTPVQGRSFLNQEETFGNHRVALISYNLWQNRFSSDPNLIGQAITVDTEKFTVVGILPQGFGYPSRNIQIWTPLSVPLDHENNSRGNYWLSVIGRLKPGIATEQASADMTSIAEQIEQEVSGMEGMGTSVTSLRQDTVGNVETGLWVLLAAVGFVLLIACANVANLMLVRAAARQKEIAIRLSLGATRSRIIKQLLTESIITGLMGGALGLTLALWGVDALLRLSPEDLPRLTEVTVDGSVFVFTLALSIATGAIFGIIPATQASKADINSILKDGARGSGGVHSNRVRAFLVVIEVAVSLVLLIGAGLMINSFVRLTQIDPGFRSENILTMFVVLPEVRYPIDQPQARVSFFEQLEEKVRTLPGVEAVGCTTSLPLTGTGWGKMFAAEGRPAPTSIEQIPIIQYRQTNRDYFQTLKVPLVRGRYFNEQDTRDSLPVAIINETLARQQFPDEDPIGKRVLPGPPEEMVPPGLLPPGFRFMRFTIIGVVKDVKHSGLTSQAGPELYSLHNQEKTGPGDSMFLAIRTGSDPTSIAAAVSSQVRSIDKEQPISDITTLESLVAASVAQSRFSALLLGLFALIALVLASVGIYGVISYSIAQRTQEIGIRMALGASARDILKMIIRQGMTFTLIGIGIGLVAAIAMTRLMSSLLYGVTATDPLTFAAITLLLAVIAFLACYIPARRATKVDPMSALRYE